MKTLRQHTQGESDQRSEREKLRRLRFDTVLKSIEARGEVPLLAGTGRPMLTVQKTRDGLRAQLASYANVRPVGIACDHCGIELISTHPNRRMASKPPKRALGCPGCGWTGSGAI